MCLKVACFKVLSRLLDRILLYYYYIFACFLLWFHCYSFIEKKVLNIFYTSITIAHSFSLCYVTYHRSHTSKLVIFRVSIGTLHCLWALLQKQSVGYVIWITLHVRGCFEVAIHLERWEHKSNWVSLKSTFNFACSPKVPHRDQAHHSLSYEASGSNRVCMCDVMWTSEHQQGFETTDVDRI